MKITKQQLKHIIKEELNKALREAIDAKCTTFEKRMGGTANAMNSSWYVKNCTRAGIAGGRSLPAGAAVARPQKSLSSLGKMTGAELWFGKGKSRCPHCQYWVDKKDQVMIHDPKTKKTVIANAKQAQALKKAMVGFAQAAGAFS